MSKEISIKQEDGPQRPVAFRLLGPFQVTVGGQPEWAGPGQEQRLLVKLLAAKGAPIASDELMRAIWGDDPGSRATNDALHKLASRARGRLVAFGLPPTVLANERGKYRLDIAPGLVDVHVFHALTDQAGELARNGDKQAVTVLEGALQLRSGEPLAGLDGDWIDGFRTRLADELHTAEQALYENAIRHGQARERLPGLAALYRDHPGNEQVTWLYMHALYRTGQAARALAVKQELDRHLADEYGIDCGKALTDLYQRILDGDEALLTPDAVAFPSGETGARVRRPGRPDPGPDQQGEYQEQEPRTDSSRTAAQGRANQRAEGAQPIQNFNDQVFAPYGVFGQQINYGESR
jgi:DNA-binding SARP family transcriptional activator